MQSTTQLNLLEFYKHDIKVFKNTRWKITQVKSRATKEEYLRALPGSSRKDEFVKSLKDIVNDLEGLNGSIRLKEYSLEAISTCFQNECVTQTVYEKAVEEFWDKLDRIINILGTTCLDKLQKAGINTERLVNTYNYYLKMEANRLGISYKLLLPIVLGKEEDYEGLSINDCEEMLNLSVGGKDSPRQPEDEEVPSQQDEEVPSQQDEEVPSQQDEEVPCTMDDIIIYERGDCGELSINDYTEITKEDNKSVEEISEDDNQKDKDGDQDGEEIVSGDIEGDSDDDSYSEYEEYFNLDPSSKKCKPAKQKVKCPPTKKSKRLKGQAVYVSNERPSIKEQVEINQETQNLINKVMVGLEQKKVPKLESQSSVQYEPSQSFSETCTSTAANENNLLTFADLDIEITQDKGNLPEEEYISMFVKCINRLTEALKEGTLEFENTIYFKVTDCIIKINDIVNDTYGTLFYKAFSRTEHYYIRNVRNNICHFNYTDNSCLVEIYMVIGILLKAAVDLKNS